MWANNVDKPGVLIESFTVPNSETIVGLTTVFSTLTPLLTNGTTYWVSAALPDDESNGTWTGVTGVSPGRAIAFSGDVLAPWFTSSSDRVLSLKVTGTLVPLPAPALLLAGALSFLGLFSRRRI